MQDEELNEKVLSVAQRLRRAAQMRREESKIRRAKEMAKRHMASDKTIKKRAMTQARKIVRKRVAGARGAAYATLGPSEKMDIDRAVEGKQRLIKKIAMRLVPGIRKSEQQRLQSFTHGKPLVNYGQKEGQVPMKENINRLFTEAFTDTEKKTVKINDPKRPLSTKKTVKVLSSFNEEKESDSKIYRALCKKAAESEYSVYDLGEIYNRGLDAWCEETNISREQFAFARVNSFINAGQAFFNEDRDIAEAKAIHRLKYNDRDKTWFHSKNGGFTWKQVTQDQAKKVHKGRYNDLVQKHGLDEEVRSSDKQPVIIPAHKDANNNTIPAKAILKTTRAKIIDSGSVHNGKPT